MRNTQKRPVLLLVLIIIVLIVIGSGVYHFSTKGLSTYSNPIGYSFDYDSSRIGIHSITTHCEDPRSLQTCKSSIYDGVVSVTSKEINSHGDYSNAKYAANIRFYHSYDTSDVYTPNDRILFNDSNVDSYFDTLVRGFKESPTFLDGFGSGDPVTKVEERKINGQPAVVIYRGTHIEAVAFKTKPYKNSIRFIGVIDESVDTLTERDQSDKLITTLIDSFTEDIQQKYSNSH